MNHELHIICFCINKQLPIINREVITVTVELPIDGIVNSGHRHFLQITVGTTNKDKYLLHHDYFSQITTFNKWKLTSFT